MIKEIVKKLAKANNLSINHQEETVTIFQNKVAKAALWFFGIFFLCGLVSRGMYGALLPRVSVAHPDNIYLSHQISVDGEIVENKKVAVLAEEGIRIDSILVKEGQSVSLNEPLVQLDLDDLNDLIESKEIEIKKSEIQIQAMEKNEALTKAEKEISQKRAKEDYDLTKKKGDATVADAQAEVNNAKAELDSLPSQKNYVAAAKEQDEKYQSLSNDLEDKKAKLKEVKAKEASSEEEKQQIETEKEQLKQEIETAKAELSAYKETLTETLKEEWKTKKAQLEEAVANLETQSKQASEQRDNDMLTATRAVEDASRETTADSSLELAKLEKEQLEKQCTTLKKIKEEGGKILAPVEGDIVQIHALEGDRTGDSALLHMTDREQDIALPERLPSRSEN